MTVLTNRDGRRELGLILEDDLGTTFDLAACYLPVAGVPLRFPCPVVHGALTIGCQADSCTCHAHPIVEAKSCTCCLLRKVYEKVERA